jgi:hypothetical protein
MSEASSPAIAEGIAPPAAPLGEDLIFGVQSIAAELGMTKRACYHQLENGVLPAKKYMGRWIASRRGLREHFAAVLTFPAPDQGRAA